MLDFHWYRQFLTAEQLSVSALGELQAVYGLIAEDAEDFRVLAA